MGRWTQWLLVWVVVLFLVPAAAWASSEVDILLNKLVAKGILTNDDASEIRKEISTTKETRNQELAKELVPDSSRNWTWSGDLRLRNEYRNRTGSGQDVNRQRIRFRYGFDAKVSNDLRVGARLATGTTSDPISTNQSFNTAFNHKTIVLDRAFAAYSPELPGITEFKVAGGIIENPFWTVGQLVWDDDLNFDGAAVHLAKAFGPMVTVFTNDGVFALTTDITEAATLWSAQGGLIIKPFPDAEDGLRKHLKVTGALAYHDYKNVTNPVSEQGTTSTIVTAGGFKGNNSDLQDLNLFNPTLEVSTQAADIPFGLFGDLVHNSAAQNGDNGFLIGMKLGKATIPFDLKKGWEGGYYFERLEPDATLGAFTDSDFDGGGTDHRGHVWWVKLATLKNSTLQLKYFNTQGLKGAKNHADTFQADWVTKF